jgi:hypothetical protein
MRKSYKQQTVPAERPARKSARETPTSGFVLVVDGQMKGEFKTADAARTRAAALKQRFPALQVRIFDAQAKRSETVELAEV